ncbi:preprotein translocase subunit SecA, partial [bacterium]|nr:preprotein translocase subunit SecA [bacterium]
MAGRGTDIKLGEGVKELGGLFVIGTNKNESRRIDNQLRGRAGRQGDPGTTCFFISLQDPLFLRFLGDKAKKATSKIKNEKYFDSFFFNKIINAIQKKIEGLNYDMRKNLIDYDTVLSNQRELIYKQRDQILLNFNNMEIVDKMIDVVVKDLISFFVSTENNFFVDSEKIAQAINKKILFLDVLEKFDFDKIDKDKVIEKIKLILKLSVMCKFSNLDQKYINI